MSARDETCRGHCCWIHGCKYSYGDCIIASGNDLQEFPCEACHELGIKTNQEVVNYRLGLLPKCDKCGYVQ